MPSSTVENYLKRLYLEEQQRRSFASVGAGSAVSEGPEADSLVQTGRLAEVMDVSPGTATAMVKTLHEAGLVAHEPRAGVRLTPQGERLALRVLRRHRLIEQFLVEVLELDWADVHEEAEELEHVVSDKLLERIDAFLGYPRTDPHGDPIPTSDGRIARREFTNLTTCPVNESLHVVRVLDQDRDFLQMATRYRLMPGEEIIVHERDDQADSISITNGSGNRIALGSAAGAKILVEAVRV